MLLSAGLSVNTNYCLFLLACRCCMCRFTTIVVEHLAVCIIHQCLYINLQGSADLENKGKKEFNSFTTNKTMHTEFPYLYISPIVY